MVDDLLGPVVADEIVPKLSTLGCMAVRAREKYLRVILQLRRK
jgi:hypothetical protein